MNQHNTGGLDSQRLRLCERPLPDLPTAQERTILAELRRNRRCPRPENRILVITFNEAGDPYVMGAEADVRGPLHELAES